MELLELTYEETVQTKVIKKVTVPRMWGANTPQWLVNEKLSYFHI